MNSILKALDKENEARRKALNTEMRRIKRALDVEFEAGVGFVGTKWQEADTAWATFKAERGL